MQRYFCLRFDVDTDVCLRTGMPNLLQLGRQTESRFTFFVTSGRAIARRLALARPFNAGVGDRHAIPKARLGAQDKLGRLELLRLLATNPRLLPRRGAIVRAALTDGHEIGLHGGRNHGLWQHRAHTWPTARLARELDHGTAALRAVTGERPRAFASPGWNSPPALPEVLAERGFDLLADEHGHPGDPYRLGDSDLIAVPTWLAGEPGGVGYLEWHRARETPTETILAEFRHCLDSGPALVCLYDHPFFAGIRELDLLERLLEVARASGRTIAPMGQAARALGAA